MQARAQVLVFSNGTISIGDNIGKKRVGDLARRPAVDRKDLGTPAQHGIMAVQVQDDHHGIAPEFQDQRKLWKPGRIKVMRVGFGVTNGSVTAIYLRDNMAEDCSEL